VPPRSRVFDRKRPLCGPLPLTEHALLTVVTLTSSCYFRPPTMLLRVSIRRRCDGAAPVRSGGASV